MSLGERKKKMGKGQNSIMNNGVEIDEKKMEEKRRKIKVAIAGVGNCASSLVQGISYYSKNKDGFGLMHKDIKGYTPADIEIVAAFDIDKRKVGKPLREAIFQKPNCTFVFEREIINGDVEVMMGPILDGIPEHMKDYPEDRRFIPADKKPVDVAKVLKETGAEILVNFVPVGAENAARFYAEECLKAGVSFVNCMPVFIVSDPKFAERFKKEGIPVAGDDIKSQLGATILHRAIVNLFRMRGVFLEQTYQLNFGGNTDFLNMLDRQRLKTKKISKTQAVASISGQEIPEDKIHIGPSDYVPFLNDTKICYIRVEGKGFGGAPILIDVKLQVEDSPNSAGVVIDVIRLIKVARDEGIGGPIYSVSAFAMKHPPIQMTDEEAYKIIQDYLEGKGKLW